MIVPIVQIGNSKGIRLPKFFLNKFFINDKIDMNITEEGIFLKPVTSTPRKDWDELFYKMHENQDDMLLDIPDSETFEWE